MPPNPSELLGSLAAKKILSELRGDFDYVIVDSSPLLAVTDAAILAAESDGVCNGAIRRRPNASSSHTLLEPQECRGTKLGAVFTMTPARRKGDYYYGHYGEGDRQ